MIINRQMIIRFELGRLLKDDLRVGTYLFEQLVYKGQGIADNKGRTTL